MDPDILRRRNVSATYMLIITIVSAGAAWFVETQIQDLIQATELRAIEIYSEDLILHDKHPQKSIR
jgi:2-hydroxy-3-keto-5-methylthiopentenyl-1-phosphate phosphatase